MKCISSLSNIYAKAIEVHFHITYLLDHNSPKRVCDENDGSLFLLELAVSRPAPNIASRGQPLTS